MRLPHPVHFFKNVVFIVLILLAVPLRNLAMAEGLEGASAPERVTLAELISAGLRDNPSIRAKTLDWQAVTRRYPQARGLPDPILAYTQPLSEVETRLGPVRRSVMLSQKFPYPGKLRVKGEIINTEVEIARVAIDKAVRDLVFDIKRAYYDLYYLDKAKELAGERINVFKHFTRAQMNDYSVGTGGFSDVVSAETRYADAEYDLILFTQLRSATLSRINTLLGRDPETAILNVAEPAIDEITDELKDIYQRAGNHESIRIAKLKVEKSKLKEKLAGFSNKPNFMVGLKYSEIGDPVMDGLRDGGRDALALTFGVSLPIWGRKNRGAREEASFKKAGSESESSTIADDLNARVKLAYVNMRSNYQLLKLYSTSLIPKSEKLIKTVQIMYKNGNGSVAGIFESRVMLINFNLAYYRAVANYLKNRAEVERLTAGFVLK